MESDHCAKNRPDESIFIGNFLEDLSPRPNASTRISSESTATALMMPHFTNNDSDATIPRLCHTYGSVQSEITASTAARSNSLALARNSSTPQEQALQGLRDDDTTSQSRQKRRSHTKSRLGCIDCKARKVKCQETWPSCANCLKRGSVCKYPTIFKRIQHERIASEMTASPSQLVQLQPTPTMFTMSDMRLFHHFLISARPNLPVDHEQVWVRDVPAFAHQYDYLMHAMLALSASHLSLLCVDSFSIASLTHRQQAIKGLHSAFSSWPLKPAEAHAMLATSYILAFQSQYMEDGLVDHILSLRGCALLSQVIVTNNLKGAFVISPNLHCTTMSKRLDDVSPINIRLVCDTLASLERLTPLLENSSAHEVEITLHSRLVATMKPLLASNAASSSSKSASLSSKPHPTPSSKPESRPDPIEVSLGMPMYETSCSSTSHNDPTSQFILPDPSHQAYLSLMRLFSILTTWPEASITYILSQSNPLSQVLLAHCIIIQFLLAPLRAHEGGLEVPVGVMLVWVEKIYEGLQAEEKERKDHRRGTPWTELIEWPLRVARAIISTVEQKGKLTKGRLVEMVMRHPEKLRPDIDGVKTLAASTGDEGASGSYK